MQIDRPVIIRHHCVTSLKVKPSQVERSTCAEFRRPSEALIDARAIDPFIKKRPRRIFDMLIRFDILPPIVTGGTLFLVENIKIARLTARWTCGAAIVRLRRKEERRGPVTVACGSTSTEPKRRKSASFGPVLIN